MITNASQAPVSETQLDSLPAVGNSEKPELKECRFPDQTISPPDSIKLTVRICGTQPTSPYSIPGAVTSPMNRELATDIALELNRQLLREENIPYWHVVAYAKNGFVVVRISRRERWTPENEYATPPSENVGLMNVAARMEASRFNRMQMQSGDAVVRWQLHIKPLEYPRESVKEGLTDVEAEAIEALADAVSGQLNVQKARGGDVCIQFKATASNLRWNSVADGPEGLAYQLRQLATRLLNAARTVEGKPPATLNAIRPREREIRISGVDDVAFLVSNVSNDTDAFRRVREALAHAASV